MDVVDQLCPKCGMCCDSTLFADVELRPGDDAKRIANFGLPLFQKAPGKLAFAQPCPCFDGRHCTIYVQRPVQCRQFECGVLKRVASGKMHVSAALEKISEAKMLAARVRDLLKAFGQSPEQQTLTDCYAKAMAEPIDFSRRPPDKGRYGKLMQAFGNLMDLLDREFLQ